MKTAIIVTTIMTTLISSSAMAWPWTVRSLHHLHDHPPQTAYVLPDANSTEGSIRTSEREKVCDHQNHRGHITDERRDEVLLRYGLPPGQHPDYEIDHLIPLCLGGSDDFTNLWPQPRRSIEPRWNAEAKDRLERKLCEMACSGMVDIAAAQKEIAADWIAAYQKYYGE
jgi:hypothetical protein